jgi:malate permease and related proteins
MNSGVNASFWSLLSVVAPIFAITAAGYLMRRTRWLTAEADESLLRLVVNFLYPCLIFESILGNPALAKIDNLILPPLVGFGTIVLGMFVALLAGRAIGLSETQARTFAFSAGIYNYGYVPIPLVQAFFGRETMGVLFTHNLGVEVAFWTVGIVILTAASPAAGWRRIFNAPVLAILISLLLNLLRANLWLPQFLLTTIQLLGHTAVPLALLLTGATLYDLIASARPRVETKTILTGGLLRLGLLPLLFLLLAKWLPSTIELKQVIVIEAAMPSAMMPIVIARHYGGDPNTALQVVLSTSLLALITIPLWLRFGLAFTGL